MTVRQGAAGTDLVGSVSINTTQVQFAEIEFQGAGELSVDAFVPKFIEAIFAGAGNLSVDAVIPGGAVVDYLRPDADDLDGSWTNEAEGTELFPSIDEASPPDDNDYIKSEANPTADICRVRLSNPPSGVNEPAKVRVRYKKTGTDPIDLTVRLKQGTSEIASWLYSDISTTFVTVAETLTAPQFAAITDFNDLFLEFQADLMTPLQSLVNGLTDDGVFAKLDRLWVFAQPTESEALVDLVAGATATNVNSVSFTANVGYTGNGSTSYIDSNFDPTGGGFSYTANSACSFGWSNTSGQSSNPWMVGCTGNAHMQLTLRFTDNNTYWCANSLNVVTGDTSDATGLYLANRTAANAQTLDRNGSQIATDASGSLSTAGTFTACRADTVYGTRQICCMGFGGQLSAGDRTNIYNRLRTYMTAVGVP